VRFVLCTVVVAGLVWGCKQDRPGARGTPSRAGGDATAPADPCADLRREFAALRQAGGACKVDDDCACYLPAFDCGGVSDTGTGRRLSTLVRMYRLAGCPPPAGCDDRPICQPVCVAGRCVQRASARVF
jgi:hypothetical protein